MCHEWQIVTSLWLEVIKLLPLFNNNYYVETTAQKTPAKATVVNFGVSFLHLNETENTEKPAAEINPKINPNNEPLLVFPKAIIIIPIAAIIIANQTFIEIFSFKNKKPNKSCNKWHCS